MAALAALAAQQGISPIEVLLDVMRRQYAAGLAPLQVKAPRGKRLQPDWDMLKAACATASLAAPFVHPRLSSVEVLKGMTDLELDAFIQQEAAAAGVKLDSTLLLPIDEAAKQPVPIFALPGETHPSAPAILTPSQPRIKTRR